MRDPTIFHKGGPNGVVLVHGLTGTPTEMAHIGRRLHERGYTVYAPILAGHCRTEQDLVKTGWRDWLASVHDAVDFLAPQVERVCIAGLSMGALLALLVAARRANAVAGIALYSTTLWYDGWCIPPSAALLPLMLRVPILGKRLRFLEPWPYGIKDDRIRKYILAKLESGQSHEAGLRGMPGASLAQMHRLIGVTKRELRQVQAPTLIVHAANDDVTSIRNADYVAQRVQGRVSTVLLNDSYHLITVDAERDRVASLTADFFTDQHAHQAAAFAGASAVAAS